MPCCGAGVLRPVLCTSHEPETGGHLTRHSVQICADRCGLRTLEGRMQEAYGQTHARMQQARKGAWDGGAPAAAASTSPAAATSEPGGLATGPPPLPGAADAAAARSSSSCAAKPWSRATSASSSVARAAAVCASSADQQRPALTERTLIGSSPALPCTLSLETAAASHRSCCCCSCSSGL